MWLHLANATIEIALAQSTWPCLIRCQIGAAYLLPFIKMLCGSPTSQLDVDSCFKKNKHSQDVTVGTKHIRRVIRMLRRNLQHQEQHRCGNASQMHRLCVLPVFIKKTRPHEGNIRVEKLTECQELQYRDC